MTTEDPFDPLFSLEDDFYAQGYEQGRVDGLRQARLEALIFGIEQGFEKFLVLGRLQAKARIWTARLPKEESLPEDQIALSRDQSLAKEQIAITSTNENTPNDHATSPTTSTPTIPTTQTTYPTQHHNPELPHTTRDQHPTTPLIPLPQSKRLRQHIVTLAALVDPATLSTANTDDAVADLDDRVKRAQVKVKLIERIIGEEREKGLSSAVVGSEGAGLGKAAGRFGDMEGFVG